MVNPLNNVTNRKRNVVNPLAETEIVKSLHEKCMSSKWRAFIYLVVHR